MRHHAFEIEEVTVQRNVVPWLETAFDWATRAATGRVTTPDELDSVYVALKTADLAFRPLFVANEARLAAQAGELQCLRAEVLSMGEGAEVLRAEAAGLTAEITKLNARPSSPRSIRGSLNARPSSPRSIRGSLNAIASWAGSGMR
jgi:hypothetical protein